MLAGHLLHLVAPWRAAVDEAVRVTRAGGALVLDFGRPTAAPWSAACEELFRGRGIRHVRPGVSNPQDVAEHLAGRAEMRPLEPIRLAVRRSLRRDLDDWERQIHARTWPYSGEQMARACSEIRAWADEARWSLDDEVELTRVVGWVAYDLRG